MASCAGCVTLCRSNDSHTQTMCPTRVQVALIAFGSLASSQAPNLRRAARSFYVSCCCYRTFITNGMTCDMCSRPPPQPFRTMSRLRSAPSSSHIPYPRDDVVLASFRFGLPPAAPSEYGDRAASYRPIWISAFANGAHHRVVRPSASKSLKGLMHVSGSAVMDTCMLAHARHGVCILVEQRRKKIAALPRCERAL